MELIPPANPQRRFGLADLRRSEVQTFYTTEAALAGFCKWYPPALDALFHICYATGPGPDPDSPEGHFHWFATTHYLQAPYSLTTIFDLWKTGYYFEAVVLLRAVVENLVQLRYFRRFPDKLNAHLLDSSRVKFIDMFETFAPGYYKAQYGRFFSSFAHGKLGQLFFRFDHSNPANRTVRYGCEYTEDHAALVLHHLTVFAFGFLNCFRSFFPQNELSRYEGIERQLELSLESLEKSMVAHRTEFPPSRSFYDLINGLVR